MHAMNSYLFLLLTHHERTLYKAGIRNTVVIIYESLLILYNISRQQSLRDDFFMSFKIWKKQSTQ